MVFRIKLDPGGKSFESGADESLLDAALRAGFSLPYGCRDGLCGACRGKILSGEIDHGDVPLSVLSEADRAKGLALFCCATARSDLHIEGRQATSAALTPPKLMPVRVESLTRVADDVIILGLKMPGSESFSYLPGQYVDILLSGGRRRAFSLATAPVSGGLLELHIRHVPGGEFTTQVFETMKERDLLRIHGPHGSFFLREDSDKPVVMVATGTGIAPLKAMIEGALARGIRRPLHLYWGGRHRRDLYLDALATQWAAGHPDFHYVPVLSRPDESDQWAGRIGRVQAAVLADFPDLSGCEVYACGSPAMVADARRDFVGAGGLPESGFFADAFTYASDPSIQRDAG